MKKLIRGFPSRSAATRDKRGGRFDFAQGRLSTVFGHASLRSGGTCVRRVDEGVCPYVFRAKA